MMLMHVRRIAAALIVFCLVCPALFAQKPSKSEMVPMRDGVKLATDVYLPEGAGPWPVLLMRSTYGRFFVVKRLLENGYLKEGYAIVVQDLRGMGTSEGKPHVFYADGWRPEVSDGADTVDWIIAQSWCNGKVGTYGSSALGISQMLLAPATNKVSAQYIAEAPASFYHHAIFHGGVFRKNMVEGWLMSMFQPDLIPIYKAQPTYGPTWTPYDTVPVANRITAPALFVGGWYDIFQQGTLDGFMARERNGGDGARGRNYLLMRWNTHQGHIQTDYEPITKDNSPNANKIARAFMNAHLKGDTAALDAIPKVQYFVLGDDTDPNAPGNEWREADTWPPVPTVDTPFYLYADGSLQMRPPASDSATREFVYDPEDPYPTLGGALLFFDVPAGPQDQRKYSKERRDLLTFMTPLLEAPVEVAGRVSVRLFVSSDAPDTDFTAKLVDVYPDGDGREINILDGIRRVKYRESLDHTSPPLTGPDEVVALDIDLWSTSWVANRGHRIAVFVSSSNYPRFEANPNTGADYAEPGGEMRKARNCIHMDHTHPSALVLPIPASGKADKK